MRRQSHFFQEKINQKETVFVSAIYDYDDHIPSFNEGDLAFAVDDMIEVTDTTFVSKDKAFLFYHRKKYRSTPS